MSRHTWLFLLLTGCMYTTPTAVPEPSSPPGASEAHGLRYIEHVTGGAQTDEVLPMVVAVHGLGDRPENFARVFDGWQHKTRVVLPAGPTPWGQGHAWMTVRTVETERSNELASQTLDAAERVAALIQELAATRPTAGKPVVTGFSQGGMISYTMAAHHGDTIIAAVPVSGFLPRPLYPEQGTKAAPVRALHGDADPILSVQFARDTVQHLKKNGGDATLSVYPGVRHSISRSMHADLFRLLEEITEAQATHSKTREALGPRLDR